MMKPYPAYKPSGVEWIGKIPSSWRHGKIKYSTYVKGRIGWQGLKSDEFTDEGCFCVTGTDFSEGQIVWDTCYHVSEERYDEDPYIQLKEDDLLITKDGTIGKIGLVRDLVGKATLNSGIFLTRPLNGEYLTTFMYWVLSSKVFERYFDYTKSGSTIQHLYQNVFVDFCYPHPPLPEQHAIARYLDDKTKKIDTLIEMKQRLIELLKEQRTAIINQAVTKGINPNVKMKDSGIEWLGEIPEHWEISRLKHIVRVKDGTHETPQYVEPTDVSFPFVTSKDVKDGQVDFSSAKHISESDYIQFNKRSDVTKGDIIMPMIGTVGNPVFVETDRPFSIKNVALFKTSESSNDGKYLLYFLLSCVVTEQFDLLSRGGVQGFVSQDVLKNLIAFSLDFDEQAQIREYLDAEMLKIDKALNEMSYLIEKLHEYRTALISEVVTGKIDVREWSHYKEAGEEPLLMAAEPTVRYN